MATVKRTYEFTYKNRLPTIPLINGQVIALRDADELYYDISVSGSAQPDAPDLIRRQVSGVKVVDGLPITDQREGIIYVDISGDHGTLPDDTPVLKSFIWDKTLNDWRCIGSNYKDENVKSIPITHESPDTKFYLTGSAFAVEEIGNLLKNVGIYAQIVTSGGKSHTELHADTFTGTALKATQADEATVAEKDTRNQAITSYLYSISGSYDEDSSATILTFTQGNGTPVKITVRDTRYRVFTDDPDTPGLVNGINTVAQEDDTGLLLTGSGWMSQDDLTIGTADKAIHDVNNVALTTYAKDVIGKNASGDPVQPPATATKITVTYGNGTSKDIEFKQYDVFSTTENGLVPAASGTGDTNKFLKGDHSWADVPIPSTGDATKYLAGDGTWKGAFTPATSSADGTVGLVPAPEDDDVGKVLSNEGWVINGTGSSQETDLTIPLYLVGANSQGNAGQPMATYSNANVFAQGGKLYQASDSATPATPDSVQVVDVSSTQAITNKTYEGYNLDDACAFPVTEDIYPDFEDTFPGDGSTTIFNLSHDASNLLLVTVADQPVSATDYTFVQGEEYSDEAVYAVGDYCVHENDQNVDTIWRCTTAITTPANWDASNWTPVLFPILSPDLLIFNTAPASGDSIEVSYNQLAAGTLPTSGAVATFVSASIADILDISATHVNNAVVTADYNPTISYVEGSFCMFQDTNDTYAKLYRCKIATSGTLAEPEDFDSRKWTATTIIDAIKYLIQHPS